MLRQSRVMVVDDDAEPLALLREGCGQGGYQVEPPRMESRPCGNLPNGSPIWSSRTFTCLEWMDWPCCRGAREGAGCPVDSVEPPTDSLQTAVDAIKAGAFDYLSKPFVVDDIRLVVRRALEHEELVRENRILARPIA